MRTIRWRERQLSMRTDRKMLTRKAEELKLEDFTRCSTDGLRRAQGTGHQVGGQGRAHLQQRSQAVWIALVSQPWEQWGLMGL